MFKICRKFRFMIKSGEREAGISVVISDLLMLAIIVIALTGALTFIAGYIANYQAGRGSALMERLLIEDVAVSDDKKYVNVTLYNYGRVDLKVSYIYINDAPVTFTPSPLPIAVDEHKPTGWLELPGGGGSGTYKIKIITERGYSVEGSFTID